MLADPRRLGQVLVNLCSNAIKFNRPGGDVVLAWRPVDDATVRLEVRDTGPGIPSEALPLVFEPFERLGAEIRAIEGTGIGLTVAKALTEAMDGSIGATSRPGVGSTFWVDLPAAPAPAGGVVDLPDGAPAEPASGEAGSEAGSRAPTVLYIEDDRSSRELMLRLFRHRPELRLVTAADAAGGLRLAAEDPPDLVFLDLNLPDAPGLDVYHRLRSNAATAAVPVVVVSADATAGRQAQMQAAGVAAYLTKPIDVPRLFEVVDIHTAREDQEPAPPVERPAGR